MEQKKPAYGDVSRKYSSIALLFLALGMGCARNAPQESDKGCDSSHLAILQTALDDSAFRRYAGSYLEADKRLVLVWDEMPSQASACGRAGAGFVVVKSSELQPVDRGKFIGVNKMYYDDSAAYVDLMLYPTGKNSDFFLRNKSGWKVTQRELWEN